MKTVAEWKEELIKNAWTGMDGVIDRMLRDAWDSATKAQRDAIVENAGGDYLWPDEIEDVPLATFPTEDK